MNNLAPEERKNLLRFLCFLARYAWQEGEYHQAILISKQIQEI